MSTKYFILILMTFFFFNETLQACLAFDICIWIFGYNLSTDPLQTPASC